MLPPIDRHQISAEKTSKKALSLSRHKHNNTASTARPARSSLPESTLTAQTLTLRKRYLSATRTSQLLASKIQRLLGVTGMHVITRVMGAEKSLDPVSEIG
jgi:hypothetical protein